MTKTDPASPGPAGTPGPAALQPAFRSTRAITVFVLVAAAGLAADLLSKHFVFASFLDDPALAGRARDVQSQYATILTPRQMLHMLELSRPVVDGVHFTLSTNPGVVFGLAMPRWAVAMATVVTMLLVGFFFASSDRRAWAVHLAMALILAGALGNLYDRLFASVRIPGMAAIGYEVRDFIDCSRLTTFSSIRKESLYPWIFNVADVWLVIGVGLLVVHWIIEGRRHAQAAKKQAK
ncbi:MAG: lipoprotein signal peptidase [Planctomycetes bacterium ADurb.Bin126]|nr:MAG: lipoprotein signal peptidase [Planctomycetes bacterium ADurb.Bin126]HOD79937.1 signal peptidase II [Phycisphaerae bacterium]HQL73248.1 signal peptidase II [Phycisphaerae bacterium]